MKISKSLLLQQQYLDSWEEFKRVVGYFDLLEYEAL